jgi:hypothetical protein
VTEFGDDGVIFTHDHGYPISVTTDAGGNIYMSGVGSLDGGSTRRSMIQKIDPLGGLVWEWVSLDGYECTEVIAHEEADGTYVYALEWCVPQDGNTGPLNLVKLDGVTGDMQGSVSTDWSGTVGLGGNFQSMAIGSDGLYIAWEADLLGGIVTKYDFDLQWQGETFASTTVSVDIPASIATGRWQGQEWVWVAWKSEIRRYPTDLSGPGTLVVDPTTAPYLDCVRSMQIVDDPETGDAQLYACGKDFWVFTAGDAFIYRFGLAASGEVTTEIEHVFDWGPSDSFSSVFAGATPDEVFVSGPAGYFPDRTPTSFTVLFKIGSP